jgi:hypothetical protein
MSANFPSTPTIGDTVTIENIRYRWTGTTWIIVPGAVQNAVVQSNNGAIDLSKGSYHKILIDAGNADVTVSFSNVPSGSSKWSLEFDVSASYTIAWPASIIWTENTLPVTSSDQNAILEFYTPDSGTTVYGIKSLYVGLDPAWDLSYAGLDSSTRNGEWDVSTASYLQNFSVNAQQTNPNDLFFSPDGTKMYIVGIVGQEVNEYTLSIAWDVSTASFVQFITVVQDSAPVGLFFKPDGLKMYIIGTTSDAVNEYNLSIAWDISTASFLQNFSVSAQEATPQGLFFRDDGLKMYIIGSSNDDVYEYNLSIAWDVSTASFLHSFAVNVQETTPVGLFFKPDGLKMYIIGSGNDAVHEYDLSTAWDVSTASFLQNFSVLAQETGTSGLFFKPDGQKMYITGTAGDDVNEYDISIAGRFFSVAAQEISPNALSFKPDGLKMYVLGDTGDDVNEYDLSLAWDITTAVYLQRFSINAQETGPEGLFFRADGLKMYICGINGDDVNEYNLSTAWDVSTASFLQNFSVIAQEGTVSDLFFKPDGLKMYIVGSSGDAVDEYDLSVAWNITTAVYFQTFSVAAQDSSPSGLFFRDDGLKMYIVGASADDVGEYDLGIAWDISTASFLQEINLRADIGSTALPQGLFFKPDGLKMFVIDSTSDKVFEYIFTA